MPYKAPEIDGKQFISYLAANAANMGANAAAPTGGAALSALALQMKAKQDQQGYLAALQAANANQLAGTDLEEQAATARSVIGTDAAMAAQGMAGARSIPGNKYLGAIDPSLAQVRNVNQQNQDQASYLKDNMTTTTGYLNAGIKPSDEYIGGAMTGAFEEKPVEVQSGYKTPENEIKYMSALAAQKNADASMVRAQREPTASQASLGYTTESYTDDDGVTHTTRRPGAAASAPTNAVRVVPYKGIADRAHFMKPGGWKYGPGGVKVAY